jgi:AcrR family transcriptional regulator
VVHDVLAEPAPLTPAGERIAAAAEDLFYRRGIRASGVDTIAEAAGTTKKTLYDRFGSKDALVALYLVRRARRWQAFLTAVLDHQPPGPGRVLAVFDAIDAWSKDATRGCAFINAYAELTDGNHPGVAVIRAENAWMRTCFTQLVADAGVYDVERVASVVHLLYEGAMVASYVGADPHAFATAQDAAGKLLPDRSPTQ